MRLQGGRPLARRRYSALACRLLLVSQGVVVCVLLQRRRLARRLRLVLAQRSRCLGRQRRAEWLLISLLLNSLRPHLLLLQLFSFLLLLRFSILPPLPRRLLPPLLFSLMCSLPSNLLHPLLVSLLRHLSASLLRLPLPKPLPRLTLLKPLLQRPPSLTVNLGERARSSCTTSSTRRCHPRSASPTASARKWAACGTPCAGARRSPCRSRRTRHR